MFRRGVAFSPAGLLTPFHLGASHRLQRLGLIDSQTALSGTSGGALAAVSSALSVHLTPTASDHSTAVELQKLVVNVKELLGIDVSSFSGGNNLSIDDTAGLSLAGSVFVGRQCRDLGARETLGVALGKVLSAILPENIHEILNNRPAPCIVGYTAIENRRIASQFVSRFTSKDDVLQCLAASCNVPFYFNGNNLTVRVREHNAVDGVFAVHPSRFGCPETFPSEEELLISPFPASKFKLFFNQTSLRKHRQRHDPHTNCKHHIISPDYVMGDKEVWPFSMAELFQMSLAAPHASKNMFLSKISNDELTEKYYALFRGGEVAVQRWYESTQQDTN